MSRTDRMTLLGTLLLKCLNHLTKIDWFMNAFGATATKVPGTENSFKMSRLKVGLEPESMAVGTIRMN